MISLNEITIFKKSVVRFGLLFFLLFIFVCCPLQLAQAQVDSVESLEKEISDLCSEKNLENGEMISNKAIFQSENRRGNVKPKLSPNFYKSMRLFWSQSEKNQEPIARQICRHAKIKISENGSFKRARREYIAAVRATEVSACSSISPGQYTTTCTFMGIGNEAQRYGSYKLAGQDYSNAIHLGAQQIDYLSELSKLSENELRLELSGFASGVTALVDLSGRLVQFSNKYRNSSNVQINSMHEPFKKFEQPSNKR